MDLYGTSRWLRSTDIFSAGGAPCLRWMATTIKHISGLRQPWLTFHRNQHGRWAEALLHVHCEQPLHQQTASCCHSIRTDLQRGRAVRDHCVPEAERSDRRCDVALDNECCGIMSTPNYDDVLSCTEGHKHCETTSKADGSGAHGHHGGEMRH